MFFFTLMMDESSEGILLLCTFYIRELCFIKMQINFLLAFAFYSISDKIRTVRVRLI